MYHKYPPNKYHLFLRYLFTQSTDINIPIATIKMWFPQFLSTHVRYDITT